MASVYTTSAALVARIGAARLTTLLDRDRNGVEDTGVLDAAIANAGYVIDMRLRQRYGGSVPFAQVGASPATPPEISRIAEDLVLFDLFSFWEPNGRDATHYFTLADTALTGLAEKRFDVDVARAAAHEGDVIAVFDAEEAVFAGQDDNDIARTRGI